MDKAKINELIEKTDRLIEIEKTVERVVTETFDKIIKEIKQIRDLSDTEKDTYPIVAPDPFAPFYSIGDRFRDKDGNVITIVTKEMLPAVTFIKNHTINLEFTLVNNPNKITEAEFNRLFSNRPDLTQISGKYFQPENLCKHGYIFGRDYFKCSDKATCERSLCNQEGKVERDPCNVMTLANYCHNETKYGKPKEVNI